MQIQLCFQTLYGFCSFLPHVSILGHKHKSALSWLISGTWHVNESQNTRILLGNLVLSCFLSFWPSYPDASGGHASKWNCAPTTLSVFIERQGRGSQLTFLLPYLSQIEETGRKGTELFSLWSSRMETSWFECFCISHCGRQMGVWVSYQIASDLTVSILNINPIVCAKSCPATEKFPNFFYPAKKINWAVNVNGKNIICLMSVSQVVAEGIGVHPG